MKISLNPVLGINHVGKTNERVNAQQQSGMSSDTNISGLTSACYMPIFKATPDASFIMAHYQKRLCAYTRRPMLLSYDLRGIYAKLAKKSNAQAVVNFLNNYENYMQKVETQVFDFFKQNTGCGKQTLQDILYDKRDDSINNLRRKQNHILDSEESDRIINSLNGHSKNYVDQIRDSAIVRIYDGSFSRRDVLGQLASIETNEENAAKLNELYSLWYQLPRSFVDFDAFVVKYSYLPHNVIAQRLLSMSEMTIEHLIPTARGGNDSLGNLAPVIKLINNDRSDMPLKQYALLNPEFDISNNLQKYIDDICDNINGGKSLFATRSWYPKEFRANVQKETEGSINLKINDVKPKKANNNSKLTSSQKGKNRYISYRR